MVHEYAAASGPNVKMDVNHRGSFTSVLSFERASSLGSQISSRTSSNFTIGCRDANPSTSSLAGDRFKPTDLDSIKGSVQHRRRGCRKCVSCSKVSRYYHSDEQRTKLYETAKQWWPGNIHSPIVYFNLRIRHLEHQIQCVTSTSRIWKQQTRNSVSECERIGVRRGFSIQSLLIPITHTNVPYKSPSVRLVGIKTLHVTKLPEERQFSSVKATEDHSKRRCVSWDRDDSDGDGTSTLRIRPQQHATKPSPFVANSFEQQHVYPGKVVCTNPFQESVRLTASDAPVKMEITHESPDSTLKGLKSGSNTSPDSISVSFHDSDISMAPVLKSQASGVSIDDPTMNGYFDKQVAIRREHAFHCHHALDISEVAQVGKQETTGLWGYIKSIAHF